MIEGIVLSGFADKARTGTFDSGTAYANFSIRCSEYKGKDSEGNPKREAAWYNVKCYGKVAERVAQYVPDENDTETRAIPVIIHGELQTDTYEKQDGSTGKAIYIRADDVRSAEFLGAGMIADAANGNNKKVSVSSGSDPF